MLVAHSVCHAHVSAPTPLLTSPPPRFPLRTPQPRHHPRQTCTPCRVWQQRRHRPGHRRRWQHRPLQPGNRRRRGLSSNRAQPWPRHQLWPRPNRYPPGNRRGQRSAPVLCPHRSRHDRCSSSNSSNNYNNNDHGSTPTHFAQRRAASSRTAFCPRRAPRRTRHCCSESAA